LSRIKVAGRQERQSSHGSIASLTHVEHLNGLVFGDVTRQLGTTANGEKPSRGAAAST
jgi:hypothetical protein